MTRWNVNRLVGKTNEGLVICDSTFRHSADFRGATGYIIVPVHRDVYDYYTSQDMLEERFEDVWREMVANGQTEQSLEDFAADVYRYDGDEAIFDFSGYECWDDARTHGFSEDEYPVFDCVAAGRLFDSDMEFTEVYDKALWKRIQRMEGF